MNLGETYALYVILTQPDLREVHVCAERHGLPDGAAGGARRLRGAAAGEEEPAAANRQAACDPEERRRLAADLSATIEFSTSTQITDDVSLN